MARSATAASSLTADAATDAMCAQLSCAAEHNIHTWQKNSIRYSDRTIL